MPTTQPFHGSLNFVQDKYINKYFFKNFVKILVGVEHNPLPKIWPCTVCGKNIAIKWLYETRSQPEMVGDMSRVTLNFDLSKIPFVRF